MEAISSNTGNTLLSLLLIIIAIIIIFKVFTLPISIAKGKNLDSNTISTIRILTWLGIFAGITWIIAICLAIVYKKTD